MNNTWTSILTISLAFTAVKGAHATSWADVEAQLRHTDFGQEALQIKARYGVDVDPVHGSAQAAAYYPKTNHCELNMSKPTYEVATYFVHEMYHALQARTGKSPNATTDEARAMGKDAWVKMMVEEEIEGTYRGFQHKIALEFGKKTILVPTPQADAPVGMTPFRKSYLYAYVQSMKSDRDMAKAHRAGLKKGRDTIVEMITGGSERFQFTRTRLGGTGGVSYTLKYRHEWDLDNKKR